MVVGAVSSAVNGRPVMQVNGRPVMPSKLVFEEGDTVLVGNVLAANPTGQIAAIA